MDAELTSLEKRLAVMLEAHRALRAENRVLTERVAALQAENSRLADKVSLAAGRVERLLASLPVEDEA
jgi:hypothetical protein